MNLIEKLRKAIASKLDEAYGEVWQLLEFSAPLGEYKRHVYNLSKPIMHHCIKTLLYGKEEASTLHHWSHELNTWLKQCKEDKVKRKGKDTYPTTDEVISWLKLRYEDASDIYGARNIIEHEYTYQGHAKREVSNEDLYDRIFNMLKEIIPEVPEISDDEIQKILEGYLYE